MNIRYFALATLCGLSGYCTAITADTGGLNYELQIGLAESRLKAATLGDAKIDSFRQSGLHSNEAVYLYYGELFQPELSNIKIHSLGVSLEIIDDLGVSLLLHDNRQDEADSEMRDVTIDLDPNGLSRHLGSEIDLIATYEIGSGFELEIVTAVFEAGAAYGANVGRKSHYWSVDLSYNF